MWAQLAGTLVGHHLQSKRDEKSRAHDTWMATQAPNQRISSLGSSGLTPWEASGVAGGGSAAGTAGPGAESSMASTGQQLQSTIMNNETALQQTAMQTGSQQEIERMKLMESILNSSEMDGETKERAIRRIASTGDAGTEDWSGRPALRS